MRLLTVMLRGTALTGLLVGCAPSRAPVTVQDTVVEPVPPRAEYRLVVMGDQGTGRPEQRAVARAMQAVCREWGCDLGVGLGDNFYPSGPDHVDSPLFRERFENLYGGLGFPFLMIPGNHDESLVWGGDGANPGGAEVQLAYSRVNSRWVMPDRFYRARLGKVAEVLAVDMAPLAAYLPSRRPQERPGGSWDAAQRAWLKQKATSSVAPWTFLLGHHPLFSNARHGEAGAYDRLPTAQQRGDAVRSLYRSVCGDVDVIFSGHDHALQLFAPQPECPGTWQVVSGAAGQGESAQRGHRPALFQEFHQPGFTWLRVNESEVKLRFYTVDGNGTPTLAFEQAITK
ncbi:metallophosphoesterase [Deinococcus cavernae]|nr:metallophosphoesterase [Deinococcus cavernae]